jgi:biotin operon repressor
MKLAPKHPPGRRTRKARAFEAEIRQLRAAGYTFESIRAALADAGVQVSRSTVQREAARQALDAAAEGADGAARSADTPMKRQPPEPALAAARAEPLSGKDIAEAFVRNRITNPLIRNRSTNDEDSRH